MACKAADVVLTDGNAKSVWCLSHTVARNAAEGRFNGTHVQAAMLDWSSVSDREAVLAHGLCVCVLHK